jgi:hypothetical protein
MSTWVAGVSLMKERSSDHVQSSVDAGLLAARRLAAEAGDGAESVQALPLSGGSSDIGRLVVHGREGSGLGDDGDDVLLAVEGVDTGVARLDRGAAGAVGRLVDVLAVDVDGVGDKGRAAMTAAGVALLKAEELQLGLDLVEEALAHCCGRGGLV